MATSEVILTEAVPSLGADRQGAENEPRLETRLLINAIQTVMKK
jgi:hypothetical protein